MPQAIEVKGQSEQQSLPHLQRQAAAGCFGRELTLDHRKDRFYLLRAWPIQLPRKSAVHLRADFSFRDATPRVRRNHAVGSQRAANVAVIGCGVELAIGQHQANGHAAAGGVHQAGQSTRVAPRALSRPLRQDDWAVHIGDQQPLPIVSVARLPTGMLLEATVLKPFGMNRCTKIGGWRPTKGEGWKSPWSLGTGRRATLGCSRVAGFALCSQLSTIDCHPLTKPIRASNSCTINRCAAQACNPPWNEHSQKTGGWGPPIFEFRPASSPDSRRDLRLSTFNCQLSTMPASSVLERLARLGPVVAVPEPQRRRAVCHGLFPRHRIFQKTRVRHSLSMSLAHGDHWSGRGNKIEDNRTRNLTFPSAAPNSARPNSRHMATL